MLFASLSHTHALFSCRGWYQDTYTKGDLHFSSPYAFARVPNLGVTAGNPINTNCTAVLLDAIPPLAFLTRSSPPPQLATFALVLP